MPESVVEIKIEIARKPEGTLVQLLFDNKDRNSVRRLLEIFASQEGQTILSVSAKGIVHINDSPGTKFISRRFDVDDL